MDNLRTSLASVDENLLGEMGVYLPRLLGALLILIFGWLAAYLISRLVRAALRRTTIDNRIVSWVRGEEGETPDIEPTIGKIVFWFVMIFVFIAFFNALQLAAVTEPLQNMVESILGALPNVVKAAVLLLVAWLLATGLRLVVRKGLDTVGLDRRLGGEMVDSSGEKQIPVSHTLSETVYWLIFLLFLPAVLGALRMEGLLAPVQNMVSKLVGFIPNLFGAAVIFLVGWFIAKILRRIVTSLLAAAGLDSLGDKAGLDQALGKTKLSGLIGLLVYMLVLIPVLISALGAMELDEITKPASQMLDQILGALPNLFGAALILGIAYVISRMVAGLVSNVLNAAGFDRLLERLGLKFKRGEGSIGSGSELIGHLVVVAVMLFAAVEALRLLAFAQLAVLVSSFVVFFFNVLLGIVIFGLGIYLANLASRAIQSSGQSGLLVTVARVSILVLAGAMALRQMNVAEDIINLALGLVLGAAAVAAAIAFGMGGRDLARQELERWNDEMKKK